MLGRPRVLTVPQLNYAHHIMKLTAIPYDELPPEVRADVDDMVESNREEIAKFREALRCSRVAGDDPPSNESK